MRDQVSSSRKMRWVDVQLERGDLGMFHIRRGGSVPGRTNDKDQRFVPIHSRVRRFWRSCPAIKRWYSRD
ncbi:MAG: hypothetical protein AAF800_05060 [Planctomycetota bacterium]